MGTGQILQNRKGRHWCFKTKIDKDGKTKFSFIRNYQIYLYVPEDK